MCFAPQRPALFRHLNLQKWREHVVFCTFRLRNVLRATTACTFSTSQLPKVVRTWFVLYILTWKCASRHNGVHFFNISTSKSGPNPSFFNTFYFQCALRQNGVQLFISRLPRCLRTRRFSEPTFQPSGATKPRKNSVSRLSYLFAHLHLLSSDLFSSDSCPCWLLFHPSILSEVWLPNFLRSTNVNYWCEYIKILSPANVNPGLINHGLIREVFPLFRHDLILLYGTFPIKQP